MMLDRHLMDELQKIGGIEYIACPQMLSAARQANHQWEVRLRKSPAGFLRDYDLLFRLVTRQLLARNWILTTRHPHQTLRLILQHAYPGHPDDVLDVVQQRHALKYGHIIEPTPSASRSLQQLLALMSHAQSDLHIPVTPDCNYLA